MKEKIQELARQFYPEAVANRRHLHQNPELSFQEVNTGRYIATKLEAMGVEFQHGMAENGVVALLKGKNPRKRVIALRGDMDALPIQEANELEFKSRNAGVMHACGHDVHTSSLLGVVHILHNLRAEWEGTVKCIFQPAEEKIPGGASIMIREGVLTNPKPVSIFGQHVHPPLRAGFIGLKPGIYMA
ncbi:MAG: amidohydrolase, partial [Saprospiraceae bacterium]